MPAAAFRPYTYYEQRGGPTGVPTTVGQVAGGATGGTGGMLISDWSKYKLGQKGLTRESVMFGEGTPLLSPATAGGTGIGSGGSAATAGGWVPPSWSAPTAAGTGFGTAGAAGGAGFGTAGAAGAGSIFGSGTALGAGIGGLGTAAPTSIAALTPSAFVSAAPALSSTLPAAAGSSLAMAPGALGTAASAGGMGLMAAMPYMAPILGAGLGVLGAWLGSQFEDEPELVEKTGYQALPPPPPSRPRYRVQRASRLGAGRSPRPTAAQTYGSLPPGFRV